MTKSYGGETVSGGVYWSKKDGEFISVPREGGRLGGDENNHYLKTPLPLLLILGPLMGAAFAFYLPLSGILVLAPFLASKLRGAVTPGAARMAAPQVEPGVSYLESASSGEQAEADTEDKAGETLIRLADAIAEKRMKDR